MEAYRKIKHTRKQSVGGKDLKTSVQILLIQPITLIRLSADFFQCLYHQAIVFQNPAQFAVEHAAFGSLLPGFGQE